MHKLTNEEISQEIIDQYIPLNLKSREKLIKKINETYQYSPKAFNEANKNNYSFIIDLLNSHLFEIC